MAAFIQPEMQEQLYKWGEPACIYRAVNLPMDAGTYFSCELAAGDVLVLLGLCMSGKTSLLRRLAGLKPVWGRGQLVRRTVERLLASARSLGLSKWADSCRDRLNYPPCLVQAESYSLNNAEGRKRLGLVPAEIDLYAELTCEEYLSLFALLYGVDRHYVPYMVGEALSLVRLEGYERVLLGTVSDWGVCRRISLARAMVHNPDIVLVDDCLRWLDMPNAKLFVDVLCEVRNRGKVLILTSDVLAGLEDLASSLCLLSSGRVLLQGDLAQVSAQLAEYKLYQVQSLDAPGCNSCIEALNGDAHALEVQRSFMDPTLLRTLWKGEFAELDELLRRLGKEGHSFVSCSEVSSFLARKPGLP